MIEQTHTCPDCGKTLILRMGAEPVGCDCAGVTWHLRLVVTREEEDSDDGYPF